MGKPPVITTVPAPPRLMKRLLVVLAVIVAIVFVTVFIAVSMLLDGGGEPDAAPAQETAETVQETMKPEPTQDTPKGRVLAAADVEGLKITDGGTTLFADFPIADNLSASMIATGARADTMAILKAVETNLDGYDEVIVRGSSAGELLLNVGYTDATLGSINFEELLSTDVWGLRDSGTVHTDLRQ